MKALILTIFLSLFVSLAAAETIFVEAETFTPSSDGWAITNNPQTRPASLAKTLHGATGAKDSTASKTLKFQQNDKSIAFSLPLDASDYIKIYYK